MLYNVFLKKDTEKKLNWLEFRWTPRWSRNGNDSRLMQQTTNYNMSMHISFLPVRSACR